MIQGQPQLSGVRRSEEEDGEIEPRLTDLQALFHEGHAEPGNDGRKSPANRDDAHSVSVCFDHGEKRPVLRVRAELTRIARYGVQVHP